MKARLGTLLLLLSGTLGLAHALFYDQPFEDSFITYRYADHLAHGQGLVYNAGEAVEGFTSFAWTVLLAGLDAVGLPIVGTSRILSLACALAVLGLTALLARRWVGPSAGFRALAVLLVAADGTWAYYATTGMETPLFAALVTLAVLVASGGGPRAPLVAGLVLGASALVRPEGLGYFLAIAAALAVDPADRRRLPAAAAVFAAVFLPYFAWRWHHFGYPLPNTYYAKASPSGAVLRNGAFQMEAYLTSHGAWVVPAAFVHVRRVSGPSRALRVAACVCAAAIANMVLVGGDGFAFYRFLLPAIPTAAVIVAQAAAALHDRARSALGTRALAAAAAAFAAWTFAVELLPLRTLTSRQAKSERDRVLSVRAIGEDYFQVGEWLRRSFPPESLIALNAAGIVPYVSGLPAIDMLGLTDVHIAHAPIRLGEGTLGHEKHDGAYVLSRRPDLVFLGLPILTARPLRPGELDAAVATWFPYLPGTRELYEDPAFRRDYAPLGAEVAPGKFVLVFVRGGLR